MKIKWLGHASFKITTKNNTSLITDPYSNDIGLNFPNEFADIITMSHSHFDHNAVNAVLGNPVIMEEGVHNYKDITTRTIRSSHDEFSGKHRGANNIFLISADDMNLCHMGDIGEPFSAKLCDQLLPVDILFIPIGGVYTIDYSEAKKYIEYIKPKIVIPMHYKTKNLQIQIQSIDSFISNCNKEDLINKNSNEINFEKEDLSQEKTKIVVLNI